MAAYRVQHAFETEAFKDYEGSFSNLASAVAFAEKMHNTVALKAEIVRVVHGNEPMVRFRFRPCGHSWQFGPGGDSHSRPPGACEHFTQGGAY